MQYKSIYQSPIGKLLLTCDDIGLTGLWFEHEKQCANIFKQGYEEEQHTTFDITKKWLDIYFSRKEPDFMPPLHIDGSPFRMEVWQILRTIPYGKTTTYGEIAKAIAKKRGISKMSAQAVGGAVGHNHISIIIPCHRVIGKDGSLTGYGGGLDKKVKLLSYEGINIGCDSENCQ